jgi:hypothetical protein
MQAWWYSKPLGLLKAGDRVWVKSPDHGFVGVGRVTGLAEPAKAFKLRNEAGEEVAALEVLKGADYHEDFADDPNRCEWFMPVRWIGARPSGG